MLLNKCLDSFILLLAAAKLRSLLLSKKEACGFSLAIIVLLKEVEIMSLNLAFYLKVDKKDCLITKTIYRA